MPKIKIIKKLPIDVVVDFYIWKSNEEKKVITNKKLQKLLYYSQAWCMALVNKPLFKDKIEAWVHGPAIRSVYLDYRRFGYSPIEKKVILSDIKKIVGDTRKFLDEIWRVYGEHDASYLEFLTHNEAPWKEARSGMSSIEASNKEISLDSMAKYYSSLIQK